MCIRDRASDADIALSKLSDSDTLLTINDTAYSIGDSVTIAGGGSGGHTIQNAGTDLDDQDNLNFEDGLDAVVDSDNDVINVGIADDYNFSVIKNIHSVKGGWNFTGDEELTDILADGDWSYFSNAGTHFAHFSKDDEGGTERFTETNIRQYSGAIARLEIGSVLYYYAVDYTSYSSAGVGAVSLLLRFIPTNSTQTDILLSTPDDDSDYDITLSLTCLLYTSPSPRDRTRSRMPSSA